MSDSERIKALEERVTALEREIAERCDRKILLDGKAITEVVARANRDMLARVEETAHS